MQVLGQPVLLRQKFTEAPLLFRERYCYNWQTKEYTHFGEDVIIFPGFDAPEK